ncbi:Protein kinase domain [Macleaya cordata]|uniref:RING-type E3 ubiquitin transferase n=1 Tax=Macleaya cordata TaxID=56857 RepID=A0A200R6I6_MACCD|nr:Protein kinase domain [Macleaya cordata]
MELLNPSPPPQPIGDYFAGFVSPVNFNLNHFDSGNCMAAPPPRLPEFYHQGEGGSGGGGGGCDDKVYVMVENSIERTVALLHWTFRQFRNREICLVHVYQPSSTIPTLLGKLPASQANKELLSVYREEERQRNSKLLFNYLGICNRSKVKASLITIEAGQVHKGIVELINRHSIKNFVMEATRDNCMKVKKSFCNADYAAKNAPPFCEIWFVNKGKHLWTREATENAVNFLPTMLRTSKTALTAGLRCCDGTIGPDQLEVAFSATGSNFINRVSQNLLTPNSSVTESAYTPIQIRSSSGLDSSAEEEMLCNKLVEATTEAEKAKDEAFAELLERRRLESEAVETMNKVKGFEAACTREVQLRNEIEDAVSSIRQDQQKLLEQREEVSGELHRTMRNVAVLDSRVQEANARQVEAARELRLIQASLATLRVERKKIRRQRDEVMQRLEQWKSYGQVGASNYDNFGLFSDSEELTEFCLSDLESATCNFSESFKIGSGVFGCVYKGELLDRSVAIKKLHPFNIRGRLEFQQEVQILSKVEHPHLVTLIGACPEALSLVYEYMPNGSIQDHLFSKTNKHLLPWKTRTRIAAEISSALLHLHSSKPEKIIHGDLKPENILLDSKFNCKIGDFGICRLVPEDTARCPSFGRSTEPKCAMPYRDPELQKTGNITPKSDIYSFGVIILQLLTGRPPVGLVSEVRRAVLCGRMVSILDPSAGEWPTYIARRLVELGLQCCEMNSRDRPELTPILVRELERLPFAEERAVPSFFLCPIRQEIMHDPHVAADGFTYEGEAIRGWLKNGRDTSPMTNLELSHLHLTPNHALQLAIRDWLCQS